MKREKERCHAICLELRRTLCAALLVKPGLAPEIAALAAESAALAAEKAAAAPDKAALAAENAALSAENTALMAGNAALAGQNVAQAAENAVLAAEKAALAAEIAALTAENAAVAAENAAVAAENIALAAKIAARDAENIALAAQITNLTFEKSALATEIALLTDQVTALTDENAAIIGVNSFLERQLDVLNAALSEDNPRAIAAVVKQRMTLTKEMDYIALKMCQATFDMANMEKTLETARAREKELEKELEDLKMTMKVEQEASFKQREDLNNINNNLFLYSAFLDTQRRGIKQNKQTEHFSKNRNKS